MNSLESIMTNNSSVSLPGVPRRVAEALSLDSDQREVAAELATGIQVMDSPQRGIVVARVDSYHFRNCNFEDGVLLGGRCLNCVFEKCNFSDTRLEGVSFVECEFIKCKFNHTIMTYAGFFWRRPSQFVQCLFSESDFGGLTCGYTLFTDCQFVRNNLKCVSFGNGVFESCKFVGKLVETEFYGGRINGPFAAGNFLNKCDFRECAFEHITFFDIDIDPNLMPQSEDLLILPGGKADMLKWKIAMYGSRNHPDFYIDETIKSMGTPGIEETKALIEAYGSEKVDLLRSIARASESVVKNART